VNARENYKYLSPFISDVSKPSTLPPSPTIQLTMQTERRVALRHSECLICFESYGTISDRAQILPVVLQCGEYFTRNEDEV
jgi:hypothetical protein